MRQRHLPVDVAIVGFARDALTREQFAKLVYRSIYNVAHPQNDRLTFLSRIWYKQGQFNDLSHFEELATMLAALEVQQEEAWRATQASGPGQVTVSFRHTRTFYMAVPPFLYPDIARNCRASGLRHSEHDQLDRFILEKPFGKDTDSCIELCSAVHK